MPLRILPVLAAAGVTLAGCGGHASHNAPVAVTKADYGRRAGAILRPAGTRIAKLRVEMTRAGTQAQAAVEAGRLEHAARTARTGLAAVTPPVEVAALHRALLDELAAVEADAVGLQRLARASLPRFLARAAAFENAPVFVRLGATIGALQHDGVPLRLGTASA